MHWFVLADVCRVLGIANPRDACARLDEDEKGVAITDTLGGPQDTTISVTTLKRVEPGFGELRASADVVEKIERALHSAGVDLLDAEDQHGRGVRLRHRTDDDRLSFCIKRLQEAEELVQMALASLGGSKKLTEALDAIRNVRGETQTELAYSREVDEFRETGTINGIADK